MSLHLRAGGYFVMHSKLVLSHFPRTDRPGKQSQHRHMWWVVALAIALPFLGLLAHPAAAAAAPSAAISVTTTGDTLDAAGGNCAAILLGSLPGPDGVTSLREAVCAANNN